MTGMKMSSKKATAGSTGGRRIRIRWLILGALMVILGVGFAGCYAGSRVFLGLPEYTNGVGRHEHVMVTMRDGVQLSTDVYFPKGKGPFPVVLLRTPYNFMGSLGNMTRLFSRYGYVAIHQDVRGRFRSGGAWEPLIHERDDGLDTLKWIAAQPWQNQKVALMGASYFSGTQWAMADALPPEVKTFIPMIFGTDLRSVAYEKGLFREEVFTMWAALMPQGGLDLFNGRNYKRARKSYPALEADKKYFGLEMPWYRDLLRSPNASGPTWEQAENTVLKNVPDQVPVPVLMVSGWYDIFTKAQLEDFYRLPTRQDSRILIGPWNHLLGATQNGDLPLPNAGRITDHLGLILNWLDHYLKGAPLEQWGPVETYVMGEGLWRSYDSWPPRDTSLKLYLGGMRPQAEQQCSTGALLEVPPADRQTVTYTYDPRQPVPTVGGGGMLAFVFPWWGGAPPSSREQRPVCSRSDVISFLSEPLERDLHIAGNVKVHLTVGSSAEDTAFTAKLIEVLPDGTAVNMVDSGTTLAYRNDAAEALTYQPGTPVEVRIDPWPIEWLVKAGSRLRVDVSSSNFPMFYAHPNRAGLWSAQTEPVPAQETLYVGGEQAYLELPVVGAEKLGRASSRPGQGVPRQQARAESGSPDVPRLRPLP